MLTVALIVPVPLPARTSRLEDLLDVHRASVAQASALGRAGVDAHLFIDARENVIEAVGERAWVHGVRGRSSRAFHVVRAAESIQPDVVHVFHLLAATAVARSAVVPARVFAEYNGGSVPRRAITRSLLRAATGALAGVFFTARPIASPFVDAGALSPRVPIFDVPEISSDLFVREDRGTARKEIGVEGDGLLVLVVARIEAPKDPITTLEAFRRIAELRPDARLLWTALTRGAEMQAVLRRVAADPVLAPRVRIETALPRAAMPARYAAADVMLHTSQREVCGTAFVEALAAGLPIAASDIPAFRAVAPPAPGPVELCPIGDAPTFARAALTLAAQPGLRESASAHFARSLSFDAIARRKLAAYCSKRAYRAR